MPELSRQPRRGSAYVLVLSIALLVTVLGMGALTLTRVNAVPTAAGSDWEEAGTLAFSATEQAMACVNAAAAASPSTWRAAYTSRQIVTTTPVGRGNMSWALKDETDGLLSEDYLRPIRVYGIGRVGNVTRIYSVQVIPGGSPLDLLRTAMHSSSVVTVSGNLNAANGPLSSNANISLSGTINGAIEAATTSGNAAGTQTVLAAAPAKTMPLPTVFADLSANATAISFNSVAGGTMKNCLLSSTSNPYGSPNATGLYTIAMPSSKTLTINSCRIVGTLLIDAGSKGKVNIQGPIEWEPGPGNYPILVITGTGVVVTFTGSPSWLSESASAANFNPAGTPYQGTSNTTNTDDYPPVLHGVIHVVADSASAVKLNANTYIFGTLICDAPVQTSAQTTLIQDPAIYASPPVGYATGNALAQVGGTWRWDTLP